MNLTMNDPTRGVISKEWEAKMNKTYKHGRAQEAQREAAALSRVLEGLETARRELSAFSHREALYMSMQLGQQSAQIKLMLDKKMEELEEHE